MTGTQTDRLDGELHVLPFEGGSLADRVAGIYRSLVEEHGDVRDVLVLKRFPTGIEAFADDLAGAAGTLSRPNVQSITRHAATVLDRANPDLTVVSDEQRIEILARAIDEYEFQNEYFERAAEHESFGRDVGRILLAATWQGGFTFTDDTDLSAYDEYLRELQRINDRFHEGFLRGGETERIEQSERIARACELLQEAEESRREDLLEQTYETVLVVQFEEFGETERQYLSRLTRDVDLVCVGERNSSIQRVWNETGGVEAIAPGLDPADELPDTDRADGSADSAGESSQIDAIARSLATGERPDGAESHETPAGEDTGSAYRITAEQFETQIREVANEIEYLRSERGWAYEDVAVLFRDSTGPIPEARRVLRRAGIPTASATVDGLGEDLAVRELYTLARQFVDGTDSTDELLEARIGESPDEALDAVSERVGLHEKLRCWILRTDLKGRIAREADAVDAAARYRNVETVLSMAEFLDATEFLPADWPAFVRLLERAIAFVTPDQYATDIEAEENGVAVDSVRVFKQDQRKAVFLCNVIEESYPGDQSLTNLFPRSWVEQMEHYPAVTTPTPGEVAGTFATAEEGAIHDPYTAYYRHLARRQLAIGVRAATDRLYLCTPDSETGDLGSRNHESRFLRELTARDAFEFVEVGTSEAPREIYTQGRASGTMLREPRGQLEKIQSAASTGEEVSLRETRELFGAIQTELEAAEDVEPRFELAVDSQIDFALGEVRTDE